MPQAKSARLVVLAAGQGSNLQAIYDAIARAELAAEVVLVVSHRADAHALVRAQQHGSATAVNTLAAVKQAGGARQDFDHWLTQTVLAAKPDLVVCAGWMLILGSPFLETFAGRAINLHPALPGAFVGKDAIGQAWIAGERGDVWETGVMVHEVIAEMDAGAPIEVAHVPLIRGESMENLTLRIHAVEHRVLVTAIRKKLGQQTI